MSQQIRGTVKVTFRPGTMVPDDWHTEVTVGDRSYVAISKWRWLACVRAGRLLRHIVRDAERKPRFAVELTSGGEAEG